jgi:hypothetical protein
MSGPPLILKKLFFITDDKMLNGQYAEVNLMPSE